VRLIQLTSGAARRQIEYQKLSVVFIDAVHDFANTWFDFFAWSSLVVPGGLIAMHDVDDFPGTYLACRKIISSLKTYKVWAYCPNLVILQKTGD
jgi:predicted O-methyltransferase YrrM